MNFDQLQTLTTLIKTKNYRMTAKQLHITSKDVRKAISSLEDELGYPLINECEDGTLQPTVYGEEVVMSALKILEYKQNMLYMLDDIKNSNGNSFIKLGSALPVKLKNLYSPYKSMHPGLHIDYINSKMHTIDMLCSSEIDILECEKDVFDENIEFIEIETLPLQVYISSTSDLFVNKAVTLKDLKNFKLFISDSNSYVLKQLILCLEKEGITYEMMKGTDFSIFKACDKDSAYIQEPIGLRTYATIKLLPLADDRFNFTYGIAYRKDSTTIVDNLVDIIKNSK